MPAETKETAAIIDFATNAQEFVARVLHEQFHDKTAAEVQKTLQQNSIQTWSEDEFAAQFELQSVSPPYAHVTDKTNGKRGTLMFVDTPRVYFSLMDYSDAE